MTGRPAFVVTGGAQGVGRAIAERLAVDGTVVVLDVADPLDWHHDRVQLISGDAGDPDVAARAAAAAEAGGPLAGWVNNAAIFRDAGIGTATAQEILDHIAANLALAVTGCHTAVRHFLTHERPGGIVNSHGGDGHRGPLGIRVLLTTGRVPDPAAVAQLSGGRRELRAAVDPGDQVGQLPHLLLVEPVEDG